VTAPTFTVVLPTYNAERTVADAIRSVFGQTRADFELIVVNDGSTDGTAQRVREFEHDSRTTVVHQENRGIAAARNAGIERARGRYVSFLDDDDLFLPRYLDAMGRALDDAPGAAFADCPNWRLDDNTGRFRAALESGPLVLPTEPLELFRLLLEENIIWARATVRRSVLEEAGSLNSALRGADDYELWLRLAARGHYAVRVPDLLVVSRLRDESVSTNERLMVEDVHKVLRLVVEEYDIPDDIREIAEARRRRVEAHLAALTGKRPLAAMVLRVRRRLGRARRAIFGRKGAWGPPPSDIAEALPYLVSPRP
jgi:glycosyltransferase involved in cell wall biosynthesis